MIFSLVSVLVGGLKRSKGGEVNLSTYHDQQSIIAKLSCKVPTQYFYLVLTYSSFSSLLQCELYHWVDHWTASMGFWQMLDRQWRICMSWMLVCDRPEKEQLKMLLLAVLNFTALLIEYSFSRHLYEFHRGRRGLAYIVCSLLENSSCPE